MKKVALISHDAGGAQIISHWSKQQKFFYYYILDGPAKNIFLKNGITISDENLTQAIKKSDFIITGTSWQSDLEKEAIIKAKDMGKYSITFLDHWANYKERFLYKNETYLPNEIWVSDKYAFDLAKSIFKNTIIKRKHNYYFSNIKKIIKGKKIINKSNFKNIKGLFLGENITEHALLSQGEINGFGYSEESALTYLLENIDNLNINIKSLKIRPHPSDQEGKYDFCIKNKIVKEISNKNELIDDILSSDIIFGCESMAMVVGLLAKKRVISCIPNYKVNCCLPFPKILYLRDLLDKKINL